MSTMSGEFLTGFTFKVQPHLAEEQVESIGYYNYVCLSVCLSVPQSLSILIYVQPHLLLDQSGEFWTVLSHSKFNVFLRRNRSTSLVYTAVIVTLSVCLSVCLSLTVWRILDVIRSGAVTQRRCSTVANWTDSIAARPTTLAPPRFRRRASADAETITGGRCFTASQAELRWLVRRLRTAGYRCSDDVPPLRHRRPAGSSVGPRPPGDEWPLALVSSTLTDGRARDERGVLRDGGTDAVVQDPVLDRTLLSSEQRSSKI